MKTHFNLKQTAQADLMTQIMFACTLNNKRIRLYTRLRVKPSEWDHDQQLCFMSESFSLRRRNELRSINTMLNAMKKNIVEYDIALAAKGKYLSEQDIRKIIQDATNIKEAPPVLDQLWQIVNNHPCSISQRGTKGKKSSLIAYSEALKRLERFCSSNNLQPRQFEDLDKPFFNAFSDYLYKYQYVRNDIVLNYSTITIINTIKVIKNLLHKAYEKGLTDSHNFDKIAARTSNTYAEKIYLDESEIQLLRKVKVNNVREQNIRDMFVIGCYTALRISDINQLNIATLDNGIIQLYQTKTKDSVHIPLLKDIKDLFLQYKEKGFPTLYIHSANSTIKRLAQRAGITQSINYKENRGGVITIKTTSKYNLISFHTARRSCITNLYKQGYPINYLQSLSGHRSLQSLQRYIRASSQDITNAFVDMLKKNDKL